MLKHRMMYENHESLLKVHKIELSEAFSMNNFLEGSSYPAYLVVRKKKGC